MRLLLPTMAFAIHSIRLRPWLFAVAVLITMVFGQDTTRSAPPCGNSCYISMWDERPKPNLLVWLDPNDIGPFHGDVTFGFRTVTSTSTIVTIINTILDTTTTSTKLPEDYKPPLTNAKGTRIELVTFSRFGTTYTSTIAFPTPFVAWPEFYVWSGTLAITSTLGGQDALTTTVCVTPSGNISTVTVRSNPQPTASSYISSLHSRFMTVPIVTVLATNPGGMGYDLLQDWDPNDWWQWVYFSSLFPDQPPLSVCSDLSLGPNWGGFTQTDWANVTTTELVGNTPTPAATPILWSATKTASWTTEISPVASPEGSGSLASSARWSTETTLVGSQKGSPTRTASRSTEILPGGSQNPSSPGTAGNGVGAGNKGSSAISVTHGLGYCSLVAWVSVCYLAALYL